MKLFATHARVAIRVGGVLSCEERLQAGAGVVQERRSTGYSVSGCPPPQLRRAVWQRK